MTDSKTRKKLTHRIRNLLGSSDFSDVIFVFNHENEAERIHAHKLLLAIRSPVFAEMFYSEWKDESEILITDASPEAFGIMMKYIYTNEVCLRNLPLACELLYLANKYFISYLIKVAERYLRSNIRICNYSLLLPYATLFGLTDIEEHCIKGIEEHTMEVFKLAFLNAEPTFISTVLKLDHLSVSSELEVFDALLNWGEEECKRKDMEINGRNLRRCIFPFLQYIRFLSLSDSELETAIENCRNTLKKEDCNSLQRSARDLKTHCEEMPEYICRRTDPRIVRAFRKICTTIGNIFSYVYSYDDCFPFQESPHCTSVSCKSRVTVTGILETLEGKSIVIGFCFGEDVAYEFYCHFPTSILVEICDGFRRNECKLSVNNDSPGYPKVTFGKQFHVEKGNKVIIKVTIPTCNAYASTFSSETIPDFSISDGPIHFKLFPSVHNRNLDRLVIIKDIYYFHKDRT